MAVWGLFKGLFGANFMACLRGYLVWFYGLLKGLLLHIFFV